MRKGSNLFGDHIGLILLILAGNQSGAEIRRFVESELLANEEYTKKN